MQYDQFIGQVQHRARLPSGGEAVAAVRATLETLAERLAGGEAKDLASQLPRELAGYLEAPIDAPETFTLDEFFQRVSTRERVELPKAVQHARVVGEVLREAVSEGEIRDVIAQLPPEFGALFAGSSGKMRVPRRKELG